ncbi:hypothetical protein [Chryseolinea sp. H1M3-3]|uniref:hypothetical protein n=1 Tax=Chryseolinea sp. H1M3-3 TaxID=3034144 RepID=UPI0023ED6B98|nr:hypothetical protein [Chryseolinea sp. H1M3-3]
MFVPFEKINEHARIWVYQANRKFNSDESNIISQTLLAFTENWLVHGQPMHASFDLKFNQFIILAADDQVSAPSGCSIDDSVRTVKKLGAELGIDFFDRTLIAFRSNEDIFTISSSDLKAKLKEEMWNRDTLVFNNLVGTKRELVQSWMVPAGTTWLKRYLPQQSVVG